MAHFKSLPSAATKYNPQVVSSYGIIVAQMFYSTRVITHSSPLFPPFPKLVWEGGKEDGKQESAGKTTCEFLFSDYLHSNLCR